MNGDTDTARDVAEQMLAADRDDLTRSLVHDGVYETVVEGGYHTEVVSDAEADFLCTLLVEDGLTGLENYA